MSVITVGYGLIMYMCFAGNFGCVYLAVLKGGAVNEDYTNTCKVAVKTLQGLNVDIARCIR